jgi:hypothetical protein
MATAGILGASQVRLSAQAITDIDILNFALNLEYIEAEYYLRAAFGRSLSDADVTGSGTLVGCPADGACRLPPPRFSSMPSRSRATSRLM